MSSTKARYGRSHDVGVGLGGPDPGRAVASRTPAARCRFVFFAARPSRCTGHHPDRPAHPCPDLRPVDALCMPGKMMAAWGLRDGSTVEVRPHVRPPSRPPVDGPLALVRRSSRAGSATSTTRPRRLALPRSATLARTTLRTPPTTLTTTTLAATAATAATARCVWRAGPPRPRQVGFVHGRNDR